MATPKNNETWEKQAQSMHPELRLFAIRDLKVIGMPEKPELTLIILHQCHLDKVVATDSKQYAMNVNLYKVGLVRSSYGNKNKVIVSHPTISLIESIQRLNYYTRSIVTSRDLIYFTSPINLYAYRMERRTLTEVQTSSICRIIEAGVARLPPEKRLEGTTEAGAYLK